VTRPAPPRLASWLLQRFAFGPQRESLIGDIVEQYEQGRSTMWYLRQTLATVLVGSVTLLRTHPRPLFRAFVFAITVPVFFATAGWLLMLDIRGHDWLTILFNLGVFSYCSMGFIVLMLTITCLDEEVSLSLVEHTRA
jgi:hypothetical protein